MRNDEIVVSGVVVSVWMRGVVVVSAGGWGRYGLLSKPKNQIGERVFDFSLAGGVQVHVICDSDLGRKLRPERLCD
jgi:hypothetical protein